MIIDNVSDNILFIFHYPLSIIHFTVQDQETTNPDDFTNIFRAPETGRLLALDLGTKHVGVAVSDQLQFTVRPICVLERGGWKKFLKQIISFLEEFDAVGLVLGLPLEFDGSESEMSAEARRVARNFSRSVKVPVFLQDERVSSYDAKGYLTKLGLSEKEIWERVDSQAAAIILSDFITLRNQTIKRKNENL